MKLGYTCTIQKQTYNLCNGRQLVPHNLRKLVKFGAKWWLCQQFFRLPRDCLREPGSWILHYDNAPAYLAYVMQLILDKHDIPIDPQPHYSPDLAPKMTSRGVSKKGLGDTL